MPLLPTIEEACLDDSEQRDHFLECIFTYHRWLLFKRHRMTVQHLQDFHSRHELSIRARGEEGWIKLGEIILNAESDTLAKICECYIAQLMRILQTPLITKQHVQMLEWVVTSLEMELSKRTSVAIIRAVNDYDNGIVGRGVPVNLIREVLTANPTLFLQKQVYLNPTNQEAELRF
jgi:uncharacterized protein YbgA (DUF1722 family)